jgi:hypothetical protein
MHDIIPNVQPFTKRPPFGTAFPRRMTLIPLPREVRRRQNEIITQYSTLMRDATHCRIVQNEKTCPNVPSFEMDTTPVRSGGPARNSTTMPAWPSRRGSRRTFLAS